VHSDATTHALEAISPVSDIALGTSAKIDDITNRTNALLIGTRDTYTKVNTINTAVLALQGQISGIERVLLKNSVSQSDISDRMAREQQNMSFQPCEYVSTNERNTLVSYSVLPGHLLIDLISLDAPIRNL
jgi:hypothetical protein